MSKQSRINKSQLGNAIGRSKKNTQSELDRLSQESEEIMEQMQEIERKIDILAKKSNQRSRLSNLGGGSQNQKETDSNDKRSSSQSQRTLKISQSTDACSQEEYLDVEQKVNPKKSLSVIASLGMQEGSTFDQQQKYRGSAFDHQFLMDQQTQKKKDISLSQNDGQDIFGPIFPLSQFKNEVDYPQEIKEEVIINQYHKKEDFKPKEIKQVKQKNFQPHKKIQKKSRQWLAFLCCANSEW